MKFLSPAIFSLLFQFAFLSGFSQQVESLHSVKFGIPGATYSYEHALGKQFSINMEACMNLSWQTSNNNTEIIFSPVLKLEPRVYYSVKRRFEIDRFTNNSASFFSISSGVFLDSFSFRNNTPNFLIVPKWGFRRAIGNHFIFETQIGGGIKFRHGSTQFMPGLDLKFGYVF